MVRQPSRVGVEFAVPWYRRVTRYAKPRSHASIAFAVGTLLFLGGFPNLTFAGPTAQSISAVEAAFVYQFTRYVEWPEETFERTGNAFAITVVGDRALSEALSQLVAEKGQDGRRYDVRYVERPPSSGFAHIVFIGGDANPVEVLEAGLHFDGETLTVGEDEAFTREGGIMRLYEDNSRLRIEVNIDAAQRSRLKISSKLLDLARIVRDEAD